MPHLLKLPNSSICTGNGVQHSIREVLGTDLGIGEVQSAEPRQCSNLHAWKLNSTSAHVCLAVPHDMLDMFKKLRLNHSATLNEISLRAASKFGREGPRRCTVSPF